MIAIENVLISDEVIEAKFVCDPGAPLEKEERKIRDKYFDVIKPYLTKEGLAEIQSQGRYLYDREFGWVTPTVGGKICAYGFRDDKGIIKCGIEQAYNDGKLPWKKPISCHLYPIKISKRKEYTNLNYEPRDVLCNPACALGKKLKVPVYQFLKEAIVRKFGEEFYAALHQVAVEHFQEEKSRK
jgi:hypothetical protein